MQCPNCSFEQSSEAKECIKCGIIFAKYNKKRNPNRTLSKSKITASHEPGPWRDSRYLVLDYYGTFPNRCFKCNNLTDEPDQTITLTYSAGVDIHSGEEMALFLWHLIRVFILPESIVTLANYKQVGVPVILCKRHKVVHSYCQLILVLLAGVGIVVDCFLLNAQELYALTFVTILVLVGCIIAGVYRSKAGSFTVRKVEGDRIWLGGVCKRYLSQLPPMPGK